MTPKKKIKKNRQNILQEFSMSKSDSFFVQVRDTILKSAEKGLKLENKASSGKI